MKRRRRRDAGNREGKGSNMMQRWRLTSESRLQAKNQLQPMLEAGKTRGKGVALSDLQML